jgi:hypothetical protein
MKTVNYRPQSAAETLELIAQGVEPWQAIGQFVDDWRRTPLDQRPSLCAEPLPGHTAEHGRWAALLAAAVEWLCAQDGLSFPSWTGKAEYRLAEPWFLYPGWRLRAWQLFETPTPFRIRNIFGGDRILARV